MTAETESGLEVNVAVSSAGQLVEMLKALEEQFPLVKVIKVKLTDGAAVINLTSAWSAASRPSGEIGEIESRGRKILDETVGYSYPIANLGTATPSASGGSVNPFEL